MDLPRARPVDVRVYVGPSEVELRQRARERVLYLLSWVAWLAVGAAALRWHVSLWWPFSVGLALTVVRSVVDWRRRRRVRGDRDA